MADAGRAMMLYRGLYDSAYTYEKLDVVNYNGSLYISTTDGNLGTEPTEETKWKLFLQGGVSDNIQATDTHGLVGEAGESSFVQLLLDSLASRVGKDGNGDVIEDTYIPKSNVLNTEEEIDANTSGENIAGALAIKSLKSNLTNSLNADKTTSHAYGVQTYNSVDNIFTAPNDGYLLMNTWGSEKLTTRMCGSDGTTILSFSCPAGESKSFFVRKGQKMWFEYASLNSVQFIFTRLT